jgi:hypothetical protein
MHVCLPVQLEESDRAAARQAKLCSVRLHYLEGVEKLAQQSKTGPVELDQMEEEEEIEEVQQISASPPPPPPPPPRKSNRTSRNTREDMDVDSSSSTVGAVGSVSSVVAPAISLSKSSPEVDETLTTTFVVTPQLRMDRIFAEHLLRNSQ